jgi:hypothetical protein
LTSLVADFTPFDFGRIAIDLASVDHLWCEGMNRTACKLNQVVAPSVARPVA